MKIKNSLLLAMTHIGAAAAGFALGIYALPILIAPSSPSEAEIALVESAAIYEGAFTRDRADSDALHWGEGVFSISADAISFSGKLAPGPDYRLYLASEFVETEADFNRIKTSALEVGRVQTFDNFMIPVSKEVDPSNYSTVIVWCETFGQYITSGTYTERKS